MKRQLSYIKAVVICHGKSEKQIAEFIKNKLRLRIDIDSKNNGKNSIQITSLMRFLNSRKYKSKKDFLNFYKNDLDKLNDDFKIFTIMDTEDCTKKQKEAYLNKSMFKEHWLHPYIVPIANSPELESVLVQSKIKFNKKGDKRKGEYISIFPTDPKYQKSDIIQLEEFLENLKKCSSTNMNEFIEFCLNL